MFAQPSLFKRLMGSVLALSFALWCVVLAWTLYEIKSVSKDFAHINLEMAAQQQMAIFRAIPDQDHTIYQFAAENEALQAKLYQYLGVLVSPYHVQVWRGEKIIYSSANLPKNKPAPDELRRITQVKPLDTAANDWLAWSEYALDTDLTVRVAQESLIGFALSYRSLAYYLIPFLISMPFLFFPVWWAISRGLRPLNEIATELARRNDADLSGINQTPYRELAPIVNAINRFMEKIHTRIQREQEFLQDAAHELKTPLAVIQVNSEILETATDETSRRIALQGIKKGIVRATHTTHQLLASARTDNQQENIASNKVDFVQVLQDRLAQLMSLALEKGIDIELDAPSTCWLKLHTESIILLVDNVIDNAIKYSSAGSVIQVRLMETPATVELQIRDQGIGIPAAYREKVFERFFRLDSTVGHGTGLGLSIVSRAAQQHAATIELSDNDNAGSGLVVTVKFKRERA